MVVGIPRSSTVRLGAICGVREQRGASLIDWSGAQGHGVPCSVGEFYAVHGLHAVHGVAEVCAAGDAVQNRSTVYRIASALPPPSVNMLEYP